MLALYRYNFPHLGLWGGTVVKLETQEPSSPYLFVWSWPKSVKRKMSRPGFGLDDNRFVKHAT